MVEGEEKQVVGGGLVNQNGKRLLDKNELMEKQKQEEEEPQQKII